MNDDRNVSLEAQDPNAIRPQRKQNALKQLLRQLQSTGAPALEGEEVLPPKLIGDGNYHWYPLAWLRWLVRWENLKTMILGIVLLMLVAVYLVMSKRSSLQVQLPPPAENVMLRAQNFETFDRNQVEGFLQFVLSAVTQSSAEGMPNLSLLEGSMDPAIYLRLQQRNSGVSLYNTPASDYPIYTIYVSEVTRWRYKADTRTISAYVKGFRMMNTISGKAKMEPYRAAVEIFWEPSSNRNRWGYYVQSFNEFVGDAADAYDAELKRRDKSEL